MKAKSFNGNSTGEIQSALIKSLADGFKPTVAFVFISIKQDRKAVCRMLHAVGIDIIGATSSGEFIDGYEDKGSAVVLLLDLPREAYSILYTAIGNRSISDAAAEVAKSALQKFQQPAFIICSTGLSTDMEFFDGTALVRSIEKTVGPQVNIYGGMAGDDGSFTGTYVFTNDQESDKAIAALVLDETRISMQGMAISGWQPIGIYRTVTKSEGTMIYTIDDQPAAEMYLRFLGKEVTDGGDKYKMFQEVGIHYPLQMEREMGAPVMRTPISINKEENALQSDLEMPTGSRFKFSLPPDFDIVEKVVDDARALKNETMFEAEALLIFSCAGRLSALGPLANAENEGLSDVWKVPMAGFYTYGEYGRAINGKQEFHSTTCCWVALKEN